MAQTSDWLKLAGWTVAVIIAGRNAYHYGVGAAYNLWAAGGPPTPNPEEFAFRGRMLTEVAGAWLAVLVMCLLMLIGALRRSLSTVKKN